MAEEKNLALAKATFETLCQTLENDDWRYKKDEENLTVSCGARGEDLPMELNIEVDAKRMLVVLLSNLPFRVQEDKRLDVAVAVCAVNNILADGSFDYDVTSGHLVFRLTNSFIESKISEEVFKYMLYCACAVVDDYNDTLLALARGYISMGQFLAKMEE